MVYQGTKSGLQGINSPDQRTPRSAVAGQVLALTLIGGFLLSTLIFGGRVTGDVVLSIVLIVAGIILTLRARP